MHNSKKSSTFAAVKGKRYIWYVVLCCLTACTQRGLHEAQTVVAQADSLWHNGQMYDDSATLAHAYNELGKWQRFYPDEYAHACYHYGKLLRTKDDPVAAMQCFIHATHTRTSDFHILGRVYNNMGDICHLASNFPLAYDMFERSADMYMRNGDTFLYYYCQNDMAFELAEQGEKEGAFSILNKIPYLDKGLSSLIHLTKAVAYRAVEQYDSALYHATLELHDYPNESNGLLVKAQVYSLLEEKDSAVYYAELASVYSNNMNVLNNALYIQTNDDESKEKDAIRQTAADRADIQKILEIRQGKLSQAVQLLEQDLNRKPDLRWLYAICVTILVIGLILLLYIRRKRRQHQLISQQIDALRDINTVTKQKHEQIMQEHADYTRSLIEKMEDDCATLTQAESFPKNICWNNYEEMCAIIDRNYGMLTVKLHLKYKLSEKEIRLCILTLFDCSYGQMADLLFYAPNGIGKYKDRVAKKIGTSAKNLRNNLIQIAIGEQ